MSPFEALHSYRPTRRHKPYYCYIRIYRLKNIKSQDIKKNSEHWLKQVLNFK